MLAEIEKDKVKALLDNYFETLSKKGYVKKDIVRRFMVWLFLADFAEKVYTLLTNSDYNKINDALICLFSKNFCLMPYDLKRSHFSVNDPLFQVFDLRITEDTMLRKSQSDLFRITE